MGLAPHEITLGAYARCWNSADDRRASGSAAVTGPLHDYISQNPTCTYPLPDAKSLRLQCSRRASAQQYCTVTMPSPKYILKAIKIRRARIRWRRCATNSRLLLYEAWSISSISFLRTFSAVALSAAITRMVSSPARVPTTSGHLRNRAPRRRNWRGPERFSGPPGSERRARPAGTPRPAF
jgi:hypothetical protein